MGVTVKCLLTASHFSSVTNHQFVLSLFLGLFDPIKLVSDASEAFGIDITSEEVIIIVTSRVSVSNDS